jgi:hypothetical protein
MNYTKLKLNDKEIGLKFGMVSDRYLSEKIPNGYCFNGDDITEIGIAHIIYGGYINNCAIKDAAPEITFEAIVDFIEASVTNDEVMLEIGQVIKVWSEVQIERNGVKIEEAKKKTTKKLKS